MKDHDLDSTDLTWLAGLARALLGRSQDAEDLVQETLVAALEGPVPASVPRRAWLRGVARRLAARRFRSEARRVSREHRAATPEALPDAADLVARAEVAEQVTAAARALPEPYRRTILLRFLEGLTTEEIAEREGRPADTVRSRVRRGLELLREELSRRSGRDWSSFSVLLLPLARVREQTVAATAAGSGALLGTAVGWTVMKMSFLAIGVVCSAFLWNAWRFDGKARGELAPIDAGEAEVAVPVESAELETPEGASGPERTAAPAAAAEPAATSDVREEATTSEVHGRVFGDRGEPLPDALVYLVPAADDASHAAASPAGEESSWEKPFTRTDERGEFRLADPTEGGVSLDLGVVANGYLRQFVPEANVAQPREGWNVFLGRGREVFARVLDPEGRPVPGLRLLAHGSRTRIGHVSPSQSEMRSERAVMGDARSDYHQCVALTDGRGEVAFRGLAEGPLLARSLDPGWTIERHEEFEADGTSHVWTARPRMGVRLTVVDGDTGRPVDKAYATFHMEFQFADGEEVDWGKWVGRGRGGASFVAGSEIDSLLDGRTVVRATFYGTVRSGEARTDWRAEPLEDPLGVSGVAEVRVVLSPTDVVAEASGSSEGAEAAPASRGTLELDVVFADGAPCEVDLVVGWRSRSVEGVEREDRTMVRAAAPGRYRLDVPSGEVRMEVHEAAASGSLAPWRGKVRLASDRTARANVVLPVGASATIVRPEGWRGPWGVHASYRQAPEEDWFGSWNYGTTEEALVLDALDEGTWRFQLTRDASVDQDPVVRIVDVRVGDSATVDD